MMELGPQIALADRWQDAHLEKQFDLHGAAITYHQLGNVAQEQCAYEAAREWYLKSLTIKEKKGNTHGAAKTYAQLGILAALEGSMEASGAWLARSIANFQKTSDPLSAEQNTRIFLIIYREASPEDQQKLQAIWQAADLGPFPNEPEP